MEHTPGPWDLRGITQLHITKNDQFIATLTNGSFVTQREANAQLIAAAPDLLEACKGIIDALSRPDDKLGIEIAERFAWLSVEKATGKGE